MRKFTRSSILLATFAASVAAGVGIAHAVVAVYGFGEVSVGPGDEVKNLKFTNANVARAGSSATVVNLSPGGTYDIRATFTNENTFAVSATKFVLREDGLKVTGGGNCKDKDIVKIVGEYAKDWGGGIGAGWELPANPKQADAGGGLQMIGERGIKVSDQATAVCGITAKFAVIGQAA